jgi:osmotically-inducible protein OsmY
MSGLTQLFGGKYNDEQLVSMVENALAVDPLLQDSSSVLVSSKKGVLQLSGKVHSASEKERVEELIRRTLSLHNLKYDRIDSGIQVI